MVMVVVSDDGRSDDGRMGLGWAARVAAIWLGAMRMRCLCRPSRTAAAEGEKAKRRKGKRIAFFFFFFFFNDHLVSTEYCPEQRVRERERLPRAYRLTFLPPFSQIAHRKSPKEVGAFQAVEDERSWLSC